MAKEKDYTKDIAEIRLMMEKSSKFLSLSGWAGIMAGIYALTGAYIAHVFYRFNPATPGYSATAPSALWEVIILALAVMILSIATAGYLSYRRAVKRSEPIWNTTSRRMLTNMIIPLAGGGILILIFISKGLFEFMAPFTLLFYGLSLYSAGHYTFKEIRYLGLTQVILGLTAAWLTQYGLLIWAAGFGIMHIVYGIYIYLKHER
jgi:hypothetical protein